MYNREEALKIMDSWGIKRIPFVFIIDFEMRQIRLFRTDEVIPKNVRFAFPGMHTDLILSPPDNFQFQKNPVSFERYLTAYHEINSQILAGNSFLLNLTFPTPITTTLSLNDIYTYSVAKYKLLVDNEFVVF